MIAAGFGTGLTTGGTLLASTTPLPTKLLGTSVHLAGGSGQAVTSVDAPLFFVSPLQINYLIPAGTPTGRVTVTVTNDTLGTVPAARW